MVYCCTGSHGPGVVIVRRDCQQGAVDVTSAAEPQTPFTPRSMAHASLINDHCVSCSNVEECSVAILGKRLRSAVKAHRKEVWGALLEREGYIHSYFINKKAIKSKWGIYRSTKSGLSLQCCPKRLQCHYAVLKYVPRIVSFGIILHPDSHFPKPDLE
jgi:hypothetical protein